MQLLLLALPLIAPALAYPSGEWTDVEGDDAPQVVYIVPNNITIDPWAEIDTTIPGIRVIEPDVLANLTSIETEPEDGLPQPSLEGRNTVRTNFLLGRSRAEFGCDQSIRDVFQEAIATLCYNGGCDGGSSFYKRVRWSSVTGFANIRLTAQGTYVGQHTRAYLIDAVRATVNPQSATSYSKGWVVPIGKGGQAIIRCTMSRFPNYVQVTRRVNDLLRDEVKVWVYPPEKSTQTFCMATSIMSSIAGAINGVAGGFFGLVAVGACSA